MKDNIPNLPGYHVTKDGKVFNTPAKEKVIQCLN